MKITFDPKMAGYDHSVSGKWTQVIMELWDNVSSLDDDVVDTWFKDNVGITLIRRDSIIIAVEFDDAIETWITLRYFTH